MENERNVAYGKPARSSLRRAGVAVFLVAGLAIAAGWATIARAGAPPLQTLAILPFEIHDTSGEAGAPDRHDAMLAALTRIVGEKFEDAHLYKVVSQAVVAKAVAAENSGTFLRDCNGCELDIARSAGADQVMIGWIYKVSSLVLTLHIEIKDVASGKPTYARVFDFRGDNEKAWQRAADYMVSTYRKAGGDAQSQSLGQ